MQIASSHKQYKGSILFIQEEYNKILEIKQSRTKQVQTSTHPNPNYHCNCNFSSILHFLRTMTTFDNTDLSAAASAIKPQLEIERLITTGAIYNPNTSKKERYEQQVIADRASNQLESIRRSVGHSGDTGRNTTSLRERYEQQLIADKAENQLRRAAAITKYQLRASLPTSTPQKNTSYSRKASDQHSVATVSTAALSLYSSASTEYDLLDNSLFEGDGLSREELATAIEFGFVEYDYDNETPQHDDETQPARDKDEEYVSFTEGQARAKAKRMAKAE